MFHLFRVLYICNNTRISLIFKHSRKEHEKQMKNPFCPVKCITHTTVSFQLSTEFPLPKWRYVKGERVVRDPPPIL